MNETLIALVIVLGLFSLGGFGILFSGLQGQRQWRRREDVERARASGTIVANITQKKTVRRGRHRGSVDITCPIVRFEAEGRVYELECTGAAGSPLLEVGQAVEVLYDSDDPTRFHLEDVDPEARSNRIMVRVGLIWLACTLIPMVALLAADPSITRTLGHVLERPASSVFHGNGPAPDQSPSGEDDYTFVATGAATATLHRYKGSDASLFLPMVADGRIVTEIASAAFARNDALESVTVPGTVTTIQGAAFLGCPLLRRVTLMDGVTVIGDKAFGLCPSLEEVTLPASLTAIADDAFPKGCAARFRVQEGSYAARYCAERGFTTVGNEV